MSRLRTLLLLLSLLAATTTWAQVGQLRRTIAVGATGGLNFSRMDFQPTIKQDFVQGLGGGIMLRYTCEKYFSMICAAQLEVNFAQRGWKEVIDDGSGNQYNRVLNYVEIPFFAHLGFGREVRGLQFFINAGPQLGIFLSDTENYGGSEPWNTTARPNGVIYQYGKAVQNKVDYGIAGGLGLELKTAIGIFSLEGRYYYGLADIFNNSKSDDFGRSANQTISVKLGYAIEVAR